MQRQYLPPEIEFNRARERRFHQRVERWTLIIAMFCCWIAFFLALAHGQAKVAPPAQVTDVTVVPN